MKLKFKILFLLYSAITLPLYAQDLPTLPVDGKEVADFVPTGWQIAEKLDGDLDSDGAAETVLVLRGADQTLIKNSQFMDFNVMIKDEISGELQWMADNNPVILAVLSKEKDGYKRTAHNHQIIPRFVDGWYRWKHSVSLKDKTLLVELMGKISSGIRDNFGETRRVYKFQARNTRLVLTEAEETFWSQSMLATNGRKDRHRKHDFLKNKGFIVSTVSFDKQPAQEEFRRIDDLISFENVAADSIETISKIETVAAEDFRAPTFTGEEISRKVLQLIKNTGGIER